MAASALLAVLRREPGRDRVVEHLDDACMSAVNLAEVLARMQRLGDSPAAILDDLQQTSIEFVPFTEAQALTAAELVPLTRDAGLSLGDRACLALAMERGMDVLTADRAWGSLSLPVRVELVR